VTDCAVIRWAVPRRKYNLTDLQYLMRTYGQTWQICHGGGDVFVASRTVGTRTHVITGSPTELLHRLDRLPKETGGPTIVRSGGNWLNGAMTTPEVSA
jgi:hypothetical protein